MVKKMSVLLLILATVVLAVSGQLSMKKGMTSVGQISLADLFSKKLFTVVFQPFVFVGIALYISSAALWLVILSQEELSFAYPLISIGYIITAVLSNIFFHESLTIFRIIGILLIMAGVYFVVMRF